MHFALVWICTQSRFSRGTQFAVSIRDHHLNRKSSKCTKHICLIIPAHACPYQLSVSMHHRKSYKRRQRNCDRENRLDSLSLAHLSAGCILYTLYTNVHSVYEHMNKWLFTYFARISLVAVMWTSSYIHQTYNAYSSPCCMLIQVQSSNIFNEALQKPPRISVERNCHSFLCIQYWLSVILHGYDYRFFSQLNWKVREDNKYAHLLNNQYKSHINHIRGYNWTFDVCSYEVVLTMVVKILLNIIKCIEIAYTFYKYWVFSTFSNFFTAMCVNVCNNIMI